MNKISKPYWLAVFSSSLGWFAVLGQKDKVKELSFGHDSAEDAKLALSPVNVAQARLLKRNSSLIRRLQAYAKGKYDDFGDVQLDLGSLSPFNRRVLEQCRKIPFGSTSKYIDLALLAGSPRAARAVGSCMAKNKIPIIIPCHRVVRSNGNLGFYSAPGKTRMKKRLLSLENAAIN